MMINPSCAKCLSLVKTACKFRRRIVVVLMQSVYGESGINNGLDSNSNHAVVFATLLAAPSSLLRREARPPTPRGFPSGFPPFSWVCATEALEHVN